MKLSIWFFFPWNRLLSASGKKTDIYCPLRCLLKTSRDLRGIYRGTVASWSQRSTQREHTKKDCNFNGAKLKRILTAARERQQVTYKATPIRWSGDFSAETLQARGSDTIYFKGWNLQPRLLNPTRLNSDLMEKSEVLQTSTSKESSAPN